MADFKTTLQKLARGDIEFETVAKNIDKLLSKKPQAAVAIMDQLKQAVVEELIDAETYARIKTRIAGHVEAAPLGAAEDDARTEFAGADETQVLESPDDATEIIDITGASTQAPPSGQTTGIDFDLTSDAGSTSASWPTDGSQTGATGTDWAQPGEAAGATQIAPGAVLRGRFQLDSILGVGGMGSVFLASDLIKVRAKDKHPRVALKVLNEDFKEHPDSFIALQREASRQQKLAHPNIATVYDFDQTEDGLAFLVMELLEGEALNDFIKKVVRKKGGLPFEEALPMVHGLGAALVYAHEHNIVHSDFKPGNCFITKAGQMKVLDFGIARAVKNPGAAEGETTIFDPGKLGALTPAYASVEMLEGEEPDTRDDIYALACVAYELLTGKHPFNKIPANKALASGLAPEPIKGMTRKQWRGLERGLAFKREDRSQNTAQFLEEFEGATSPFKNPFIMVPAVAVLLLAVGLFPILGYLDEQDTQARIALAQSSDPANIQAVLDQIDAEGDDLDPEKRDRILTGAKNSILAYFDKSARDRIDVANGQYDFIGAELILSTVKENYTILADSSVLLKLGEDISDGKNRLFAEQFDKFNTALEEGSLLDVEGENDIHDAMAIVGRVDPEHPMLKDRRIPGAFAVAINQALENQDFDYADDLSSVGLGLVESVNLTNLTDKIGGARERAEATASILAAIAAIQEAVDSGEGLAGYLKVQDSIADLAALDPGNELLGILVKDIQPRATKDLAALENSKDWSKSELMLGDYSRMLRSLGLHDQNARTSTLREEFTGEVSDRTVDITTAVAAGELTPQADQLLAQLATIAPRNERTLDASDQGALAHLRAAQNARDQGNLGAGTIAIESARKAAPGEHVLALIEDEAAILGAEAALDDAGRSAAMAERRGEFDAAYQFVSEDVNALESDPEAFALAFDGINHLRGLNPTDGRVEQLASTMATQVEQGAGQLSEAKAWDNAVALMREGLVNLPQSTQLSDQLLTLQAQRRQALIEEQRQRVAVSKRDIKALLQDPVGDRSWRFAINQKMAIITAEGEPNDPWLAEIGPQIAKTFIEQATAMRSQQRFAEGANLLGAAERYAPDSPGLAAEREALAAASEAFEREQAEQQRLARIDGLKQTFKSQALANDVANASKTLDALKQELGETEDAFLTSEAPRLLANAYYKLATIRATRQDYSAALRFAEACAKLQPQSQECRLAVREYRVGGHSEDLAKIFKSGSNFDISEVYRKISEVQILDPGVFSNFENPWAQGVAARLKSLKDEAGAGANEFIQRAKEIFVGNPMIAAIAPVQLTVAASQYAGAITAAIAAAKLSEARKLIKEANKNEAQHPDIVRLKGAYNARVREAKTLYETYQAQYGDKDYDTALTTIQDSLKVWSDSSTFKKEYARVVAKISAAAPAGGAVAADWKPPPPLPPTDPCVSKLAGHGKRKKGQCFYYLAGNQRGPTMVVIPAGESFDKPFAIGKYEIMVGDYNRYCNLSRQCEAVKAQSARLPITGITLEQAQAYIAWLSERTEKTYRLPTASEWTYAAQAGGDQPKKDYNCRVEQGGQVLKGQGTMGVNTGKANGWGLYNYVGNVQEWVQTENGVIVRGGAFEDSFSKCAITLEKPHEGGADGSTGFRVLQELG